MWALSGLPALATVARVASETRLESGESAEPEAGAVRSGVSRTRSVVPRWRVAVPAAPAPVGGAHVGRSAVAGAPRAAAPRRGGGGGLRGARMVPVVLVGCVATVGRRAAPRRRSRAACALCPGPGVRVNLLTLRPLDRQHTQPGKSLSRTPKRMCDRCVSARNANAASRLCAGERPIVSSEERDPFLQLYLASE